MQARYGDISLGVARAVGGARRPVGWRSCTLRERRRAQAFGQLVPYIWTAHDGSIWYGHLGGLNRNRQTSLVRGLWRGRHKCLARFRDRDCLVGLQRARHIAVRRLRRCVEHGRARRLDLRPHLLLRLRWGRNNRGVYSGYHVRSWNIAMNLKLRHRLPNELLRRLRFGSHRDNGFRRQFSSAGFREGSYSFGGIDIRQRLLSKVIPNDLVRFGTNQFVVGGLLWRCCVHIGRNQHESSHYDAVEPNRKNERARTNPIPLNCL